jgi:hypothetical protein
MGDRGSFGRAFDELGVRTTLWDWSELLEPLPSKLHARRFAWPLLYFDVPVREPAPGLDTSG